jgi:NAD(P)-dependent dehydrogenase (short-subunit alcohol dehydrogenase family)
MSRVALVTGGAVRIGRHIVERLAREAYAVAIHCRRSAVEAEELAQRVVAAGGRAAVIVADLNDPEAVRRMVPQAVAALGELTLLVNNASEFEEDTLPTLREERWERHFAINLRSPVFLARDFAAQASGAEDPSIVNILDQRVLKLTPQFFSYTLTKAALHTATITMAQALAPRIRVNAIGPGPTLGNSRQAPEDFEKQRGAVLLGRGSAPEEVAEAVAYLARSPGITGQLLAVDGGQHLAWETADVYGITE